MGSLTSIPLWQLATLGLVGLVIALSIFRLNRGGMWAIGGMLFMSALGVPGENVQQVQLFSWLSPLQSNRSLFFTLFAGLLWLGVLFGRTRVRFDSIPIVGLLFLLLGMYMGVLTLAHEGEDGIEAAIFAGITIAPVLLQLPGMLEDWEDFRRMLRVIGVVSALWTLACTVQFLINQEVILATFTRRFVGLLANPQHAAVWCSTAVIITTWLALNESKRSLVLFWAAVAASHAIFVLWTGSRTGALVTLIGLAFVFYSRIGRAVIFAPVIAVFGYGLLVLATDMGVKFGFERLVSTDDTRSVAWMTLLNTGLSSPMFGVGTTYAGASENSFLFGFAAYGVGVVFLLFIAMVVTMVVCVKLLAARSSMPPRERSMVELLVGFFTIYWLGAQMEGYAVARTSTQLVVLLAFACMATCLLRKVKEDAAVAEMTRGEDQPFNERKQALSDDNTDLVNPDYAWYGRDDR